MAKLVQRKPEDHETVKHRVPFLITTYFGPIAWILAAALTKEYSPESCLASSSLIVITSTRFITSSNSGNAQSIQNSWYLKPLILV
jgi:hypothetical protein